MKSFKSLHVVLALSQIVFALTNPISLKAQTIPAQVPNHPRILLLKGEESNIINGLSGSDSVMIKVNNAILAFSNTTVEQPPVQRLKIGMRLLDKSRLALQRLFYLSYAYRTTHQDKYLQRARQELLEVSAFTDWNPDHFLDVAEMTMGVSIAYDWLYNDLDDNTRKIVSDAIIQKALIPSLDPRYSTWQNQASNWNQVCNAGLSFGALAVFENQPDLAKTIIKRAVNTLSLPMHNYAPDGQYPEGYDYWGYGTGFTVMFINAMEKAFKTDFGLSTAPGFLKTPYYREHMSGPTLEAFNYSDCGAIIDKQPNEAMFWFANKLKDPSLLWMELEHIKKGSLKDYTANRLLPAIMIWRNGVNISSIQPPTRKMFVAKGQTPVALMRTSWADPSAIFVGIKGGSPSDGHAHMDEGSFVMEADGERWAMDFGAEDYNAVEQNTKSIRGFNLFANNQQSGRWRVFRYNNFAHSTIIIDSGLQKVDGKAIITSSSSTPLFMNAIVNTSDVYKGAIKQSNRGIAIVKQKYVVVRDELTSLSHVTNVRWNMLTGAKVKITSDNQAELTLHGKKLFLIVKDPDNVSLKTWKTDAPNSYESKNTGTTFVGFEFKIPANTTKVFTILLVPEKAMNVQIDPVNQLALWPQQ